MNNIPTPNAIRSALFATPRQCRVSLLRAALRARFPRDMADLHGATTLAEAETVCGVRCWEAKHLGGGQPTCPDCNREQSFHGRCDRCEKRAYAL
jgi:hypothetical protein